MAVDICTNSVCIRASIRPYSKVSLLSHAHEAWAEHLEQQLFKGTAEALGLDLGKACLLDVLQHVSVHHAAGEDERPDAQLGEQLLNLPPGGVPLGVKLSDVLIEVKPSTLQKEGRRVNTGWS